MVDTNRLIADLLAMDRQTATTAARVIAGLVADSQEATVQAKASKFELDWLLGHLRQLPVEMAEWQGDGEDREPVTWALMDSAKQHNDEALRQVVKREGVSFVASACPRLHSLMKGELPSLRSAQEGRL